MPTRMQQRRSTAAQWTSANSVLAAGEIGVETDTRKFKIGDGTTVWNSLGYAVTEGDISAVTAGTGLTGGGTSGQVTLSIDSTVATLTGSQTLTNKTVNLTDNTLTGTVAQFNTALSDANFITTTDSGTVTSAMIADGAIVNADINASAAIALSKLATDPLARANHTGTQTASTISNFDTQVRTSRLDQMAAPTASVSLNSQKITNLATPTESTDAVTKAYVDSAVEGLHVHASVKAATTANVALATALENGDTLDGVVLATGDRILVKNQTNKAENGIYVVQATGQPSRATDFDTAAEVDSGDFVFVDQGTTQANTGWVQINTPAVIGTNDIEFVQFSGAGTYLAGTGLTLTGNTFSINTGTTVDLSTAQTLTNKTLTSPIISSISNSGTVTIPTGTVTLATLAGTETLSGKTLTAPRFATSGKIDDANGAELIRFPSTVASAVNEITISNAATGSAPTLSATGDDTNISLGLTPKGSGVVSANGVLTVTGSTINLNGSTPAIASSSATAASIFTSNVTGITIGSSSIKSTLYPADGTTDTGSAGVGYMGMPQNARSAAYTLTAADAGRHIYYTASGQTLTIPANATVAFPIGTTISVINANGVSTTISIATDTLRLANSTATGNRTLASNGFATMVKVSATEWIIGGNGIS